MSVAALWEAFEEEETLAGLAGPFGGGEPLPVTYPDSLLGCKVWIAPGADLTQPPGSWPWADITNYVRHATAITVRDGRKDEHALVEAGSGELTLDNRDGRFSRRNPASPYYPLLTKNTPILATIDPGSGQVPRMEMFVNSWPNRSDISGNDRTMPISCAGILRRLGQGSVLNSALRQITIASNPAVYWSFVGGSLAQSFAVTAGTGSPITLAAHAFTSAPDLGSGAVTPDGPTATWLEAGVSMVASGGSTATSIIGDMVGALSAAPTRITADLGFVMFQTAQVLMYLSTDHSTTGTNWSFGAGSSFSAGGVSAYVNGTNIDNANASFTVTHDEPHHVRLDLTQNGANVNLVLYFDGTAVVTDTFAGITLAQYTSVRLTTYSGSAPEVTVFLSAVWDGGTAPDVTQVADAVTSGFTGEQAHERIIRLCGQAGVPLHCAGGNSTRMGPQELDTLLNSLRAAEAADLGVLYETGFGLGYQCRSERHNAPVGMSLDFNQHIAAPPASEDDDFDLTNSFTARRIDGAEYTAFDGSSISSIGLYDDSASVNLEDDDQVANAASWRVHILTSDEERWPGLSIDFASVGGRTAIPDWLALPFGARVNVANPPDTYSPYPVDVFIEGRTERWDPISWDAEFTTSPAWVSEVYEVASTTGNRGRVDSSTSTLGTAIGTGDTSLSVVFTGVRWIDSATYPTYFPFDIEIGREQMTVTAITATTSPQTFTVTRSVNGAVLSHPAGTAVHLWKPSVYAM